ncbi:MAG TPA: peptide-methionine (S)-S-oxide reductase MsrA [Candidatus Nanoarchaeia archaeon]|nr:peptide-methionine (S)-S-oxide reductase MsrA [Candidatus Nanoarchaeia archaeon]
MPENNLQKATFAGGCFWCTEAIFKRLKGVRSVMSGYAGGAVENPSYEEVSSGETGHAEATQIIFDPLITPYDKLLKIYWASIDPTTLNRQGNDVGSQYRSVIFYHDEAQKTAAEKSRAELAASGKYSAPIVTAIEPFANFYPAEDYHRDYYDLHKDDSYSRAVIAPKIKKLEEHFAADLK